MKDKIGKQNIGKYLAGLLYPARCPVCDRVRPIGQEGLCPACRPKLLSSRGDRCLSCGSFLGDEAEYCSQCEKRRHSFDEAYGVFPYEGWARESMLRMKFHGRREYAAFFADQMASWGKSRLQRWRPDKILPVPMHRKKKRRRGYDQAEDLARELADRVGIPYEKDLLLRVKATRPQKELDPSERKKNLRQAFALAGDPGKGSRILLVDDIYTTGTTGDVLAELLKGAGVGKVYLLTACTGGKNTFS